ncbi:MAG: hypothetical protein CUN55_17625 [Phototrophicales bacterium]|nr:MAG: hypothetical protein CUN55_17625 [Phototrophicales bacterium]
MEEIYFHLHSIQAEPMIILSDDWSTWDTSGTNNALIPDDASVGMIIRSIQSLIQEQTGIIPELLPELH